MLYLNGFKIELGPGFSWDTVYKTHALAASNV